MRDISTNEIDGVSGGAVNVGTVLGVGAGITGVGAAALGAAALVGGAPFFGVAVAAYGATSAVMALGSAAYFMVQ